MQASGILLWEVVRTRWSERALCGEGCRDCFSVAEETFVYPLYRHATLMFSDSSELPYLGFGISVNSAVGLGGLGIEAKQARM